jgi:SHS family lactate transporter-like MFS transporter
MAYEGNQSHLRVDHDVNDDDAQHMSVGQYLRTRVSTLKPPMAKVANPFTLLRTLNLQQWLFFLCGFVAWTWDAFDFFTVVRILLQLLYLQRQMLTLNSSRA